MTRTAVVTGATSGLGAAFVHELAGRGWSVLAVGRDSVALATLVGRTAPRVRALAADLARADEVARVEEAIRGDPTVALLVNDAAVGLPFAPLVEQEPAALGDLVAVNVTAVLRLTRAALAAMDGRGGGILTVSTQGAAPAPGLATYTASKAFVDALGDSVREEARRRGVTVTTLRPGYVATGFHARSGRDVGAVPAFEWQRPEVVARAALTAHARGRAEVWVPRRVGVVRARRVLAAARRVVPRARQPSGSYSPVTGSGAAGGATSAPSGSP